MGKAIYEASEAARRVFNQVEESVGTDMRALCFDSDDETLRQTRNAQLALYAVGVACYSALVEAAPDLPVKGAAGHSVGEYAALGAAGWFEIGDGAALVQRRGELMSSAGSVRPGGMAAVLGLDRDAVERVCSEVDGVCVVANDNCPGQLVVSGDKAAIDACAEPLKAAGAKRVLPLNVSGAFHSPLMEESATSMGVVLQGAEFLTGKMPVYSNVTAKPGDDWPGLLEEQLRKPVKWTETINQMVNDGFTQFIECGNGNVLAGLIRRTNRDIQVCSVGDPESLASALETVREASK